MKNFKQRYINAKTAIEQIRAGEWRPHFNSIAGKCLHATRGNLGLWIGNGAWFCEMEGNRPYFGLLFRHWVWWAAARKLANDANAFFRKDFDKTPVLR